LLASARQLTDGRRHVAHPPSEYETWERHLHRCCKAYSFWFVFIFRQLIKKGAFGGKLKDLSATELGGIASRAAIASVGKPIQIDSVIYGNVLQTSTGAYLLYSIIQLSNI
jgi:hypothetical protein